MRQNMTYILVGQQGVGKTGFAKKMIEKILNKNPSIDKLVVIDEVGSDIWQSLTTFDSYSARKIVPIRPSDLIRLKKGLVLLEQRTADVKPLLTIVKNVRNAIIVLEDATRYIPSESKVPDELMSILLNAKQRNTEVILIFHSLVDIPPKIARNIRIIVLFKTLDHSVPKKLLNPSITTAFEILKASKNNYDYKTIAINVPR